mmetsp:Transcript_17522/g.24464  ORF Transcript_17522/g.24464 Transcript_17522/m.24464 type:complete len:462 (+) Transcript_17522:106-1491(+)|eukprot:CAMPEP_0185258182 /NCGR_PEP_ID=MMETSP1359-20130426/7145_1 /TAXON_ID=552665 /ORGANISM="Bigelowiella longifila, Strain CCMP242" /LENGTH=461 /DNA_ID=CAMNT_0027843573 /DNA_START=36 /DNA_END=1421 /DNA_ORIENTATION=+
MSERKSAVSNPVASLDANSIVNPVAITSNFDGKNRNESVVITENTKVSPMKIEIRDGTCNVDDVTHIPSAPRHPCGDIRKSDYNRALLQTKETPPLDSADNEVCAIYICHSLNDTSSAPIGTYDTWFRDSKEYRRRIFPPDFSRKFRFLAPEFEEVPKTLQKYNMDLKTWNDALVAVFRLQSEAVLKARRLKKLLGKNPHRLTSEQLGTTIKYAWNGSLKIRTLRNCSLWCDKCASNCVIFYLLYAIMFTVELLIAFLTLPIVGIAALYDWCFDDPSRKTKFKKWEIKTKAETKALTLNARHIQIESGMRALAKTLHRKMEKKHLLICYKAGTKTKHRKEAVDDKLSLVHNIVDTHFMIIFSTRKKKRGTSGFLSSFSLSSPVTRQGSLTRTSTSRGGLLDNETKYDSDSPDSKNRSKNSNGSEIGVSIRDHSPRHSPKPSQTLSPSSFRPERKKLSALHE